MRVTVVINAALALALVATVLTDAAPARAAACDTTTGVTVVVDFAGLGGGVVTGCAGDDPTSGFAALASAGFRVTQVANMPGFVCRIDGRPTADIEPCVDTPPASALWNYWTAERGGSWRLSVRGAGNRVPPPGSVEGWSFSQGGITAPSVAPPPPVATTTTSTTTTTTTSAPVTTTTTSVPVTTTTAAVVATTSTTSTTVTSTTVASSVVPSSTTSTRVDTTTSTTSTSVPVATTTTIAAAVPSAPTSTSSVPESVALGTPAAPASEPTSGPTGTFVGVGLVGVVGLGAWWASRRRVGG